MEQWNNLAPVDQLQRLVPHLDEDIGKTLFLATPKPKRKEAKENNSNFKALSFLQKLILVANKPKMAQKAVNNDLCASAVQAAVAELDRVLIQKWPTFSVDQCCPHTPINTQTKQHLFMVWMPI